jgi:hypothetical protein
MSISSGNPPKRLFHHVGSRRVFLGEGTKPSLVCGDSLVVEVPSILGIS